MMKFLVSILTALGLMSGGAGYENVSVNEFSRIIAQKDVQILDVRTPEEYAEGHIEGALLANYNGEAFKEDALKVLDKGKKVAVYCRSGRRSALAAEILSKEGFTLYNLETGINGWTKDNKPLVK